MIIWIILAAIAFISLAVYFNSRNAVWGTFILGTVAGTIVEVISFFYRRHVHVFLMAKIVIISVLLGLCQELIFSIGDAKNRKLRGTHIDAEKRMRNTIGDYPMH